MKKIIVYITLAILLASCSPSSRHSGEVTGVGGTAWNEPTPYGMVLISRGSYKMDPPRRTRFGAPSRNPDRSRSTPSGWTRPKSPTRNTNSLYSGCATPSSASVWPTLPTAVTRSSKSKRTAKETPSSPASTGTRLSPGATPPKTRPAPSRASTASTPLRVRNSSTPRK